MIRDENYERYLLKRYKIIYTTKHGTEAVYDASDNLPQTVELFKRVLRDYRNNSGIWQKKIWKAIEIRDYDRVMIRLEKINKTPR